MCELDSPMFFVPCSLLFLLSGLILESVAHGQQLLLKASLAFSERLGDSRPLSYGGSATCKHGRGGGPCSYLSASGAFKSQET